jgi:hypothetical protein
LLPLICTIAKIYRSLGGQSTAVAPTLILIYIIL